MGLLTEEDLGVIQVHKGMFSRPVCQVTLSLNGAFVLIGRLQQRMIHPQCLHREKFINRMTRCCGPSWKLGMRRVTRS